MEVKISLKALFDKGHKTLKYGGEIEYMNYCGGYHHLRQNEGHPSDRKTLLSTLRSSDGYVEVVGVVKNAILTLDTKRKHRIWFTPEEFNIATLGKFKDLQISEFKVKRREKYKVGDIVSIRYGLDGDIAYYSDMSYIPNNNAYCNYPNEKMLGCPINRNAHISEVLSNGAMVLKEAGILNYWTSEMLCSPVDVEEADTFNTVKARTYYDWNISLYHLEELIRLEAKQRGRELI